jgi:anionic cell wall polymer biosynthesis LytR-Cps2A-Psr (LCP) family protein
VATGKQKSKKAKKRLLGKFLTVFVLAFITLSILVGIGTGAAILISKNMGQGHTSGIKGDKVEELKKITTFAVFGLDQQKYRTDVVMLLFFNSESKKINIVSIPRDTMVTIPDDMYAEIQERRSSVEQTIKINEIPAY